MTLARDAGTGLLQAQFVQVDEVHVRHLVTGEGEPVVLLHGFGRSLDDWAGNIPALATRHRVYALDMLGFGLSDKPDVPYSVPGMARFVRRYLDAVGETRPVTLVGNSLGGVVSQQFLVMYPQQVRGLVLVDSAGFSQDITSGLRLVAVPVVGPAMLAAGAVISRYMLQHAFHDPSRVTPDLHRQARVLAQQPGVFRTQLRFARMLGDWRGLRADWRSALTGPLRRMMSGEQGEAPPPALIIWGASDRILHPRQLDEARTVLPQAEARVIEEAGHMPQLEQPEEFNRVLLEFLGRKGLT